MHANLKGHPGDGLTNFDTRILEHVQKLLDARAEDLGEVLLVRAVGSGSKRHECSVPFLPLGVHDICLNELHD